jgi:hypothetical protein
MRWVTRPRYVEGAVWNGEAHPAISRVVRDGREEHVIHTPTGYTVVHPGDVVYQDHRGHWNAIMVETFLRLYEPAPDADDTPEREAA